MPRSTKIERLAIYQNSKRVGILERSTSGAIRFAYAPTWLEGENSFPISMNLPLQETAFKGGEVVSFFDGLLPDNTDIRNKVAQRVKAESARTFDLLSAIGHDCVGALQFLDEAAAPPEIGAIHAAPLSNAAIAKTLKSLGFFPLGMQDAEPDFRISIAGAQEKTALLKWKNKWHLPRGSTPTTHILKPPMGTLHNGIDLSTSVENEWLCLKICGVLGLKVPNCEISSFQGKKCLVVERFDRRWTDSKTLIRVPQEDLCQALGYSPTQKYEADGGPGIKQIMAFLNSSDERNQDRSDFMRSQLIFYLLAATDGHAKNYSIFLYPNGFKLAPFYDVMSVFPAIEKKQFAFQRAKLAMALGNSRHYRLKQIARRHFEQTAKQVGFPATELNKLIEELKAFIENDALEQIKVPKGFPASVRNPILKGIKKQAAGF